jgi:hypothetical protein
MKATNKQRLEFLEWTRSRFTHDGNNIDKKARSVDVTWIAVPQPEAKKNLFEGEPGPFTWVALTMQPKG